MSESLRKNPDFEQSTLKRSMKNYLLSPGLQTWLAFYSIVISFIFAASVFVILYLNFYELVESILLLTDAQEEVRILIQNYWTTSQFLVYVCLFVYIALMVGVTIWYTHRMVGPTIAFRRHILSLCDGKYVARTNLRKGDAFLEVAEALNQLSEQLAEKQSHHSQNQGEKQSS